MRVSNTYKGCFKYTGMSSHFTLHTKTTVKRTKLRILHVVRPVRLAHLRALVAPVQHEPYPAEALPRRLPEAPEERLDLRRAVERCISDRTEGAKSGTLLLRRGGGERRRHVVPERYLGQRALHVRHARPHVAVGLDRHRPPDTDAAAATDAIFQVRVYAIVFLGDRGEAVVRVLGIVDVGEPAVLLGGPEVDVGVDDARGWAKQGAEAVAGGFAIVVLLEGVTLGRDTGIN